MSYPINYPTPQGANVQIFRGGDDSSTAHVATREWVKPQGASFVWFTLIGAGGGGGGGMLDNTGPVYYKGGGGASGNVTNFMCPAFLLPDVLQVAVGRGGNGGAENVDVAADNGIAGNPTQIIYQQKNNQGYTLLQASGGGDGGGANFDNASGGTGQAADTGGPMTAAGFYNATKGMNGANGNNVISTDGITFVMGGSGTTNSVTVTGYYGYTASNRSGYSQIQPIIMSIAGSPEMGSSTKGTAAPFGCGGNGGARGSTLSGGGRGGDGLAIIVTW